jgi:hypothetical protein
VERIKMSKELEISEEKFFDLEEEIMSKMELYKIACEERDLDFEENIELLVKRATGEEF